MVDGLQRVDNTSTIVEVDGQVYNMIEVVNPAAVTEHGIGAVRPDHFGDQLRHLDLRNVRACSPPPPLLPRPGGNTLSVLRLGREAAPAPPAAAAKRWGPRG